MDIHVYAEVTLIVGLDCAPIRGNGDAHFSIDVSMNGRFVMVGQIVLGEVTR